VVSLSLSTASNAGHVRIYDFNGTAWVQRGDDIDGEAESDESGYSVSLSSDGDIVAIGAVFNDGTASNAGHVRVYAWNGTAWVQRGADIDGEAGDDTSGFSVSVSSDGETLAVGATSNDGAGSNAGHVRVYTWSGTAWVQRGLDIDGEAAGDSFGFSVALSNDGESFVVGGPLNDDGASGAGHARVYDWTGTAWVQRASDMDGAALLERLGLSTSISGDGGIVAMGAPGFIGVTGYVKVFNSEILATQTTVTATLDAVATGNVVVTLDVSGTATGDDTDYSLSSTTITIPQDQTTATASVTVVGDATSDDDDETVILDIDEVTGAVATGNPVTITIDEGT